MLTPPIGMNLFVVAATAGDNTTVMDVVKGIGPFLLLKFRFWQIVIFSRNSLYTCLPRMFGK